MASFWEVQRMESVGMLLDDMMTYVSQPDVPGKNPAIIIGHEALGISNYMRGVADRYAAAGFFVVVPALYHREGNTEGIRGTNPVFDFEDVEGRQKARGNLNDDQTILDINTTIAWLQRSPRVLGDKIGIVGFCMGGRVAYLAAAACPGLSAASCFYPGDLMKPYGTQGPSPFDLTPNIQCPIMGNWGGDDNNPTVEEVGKFEAELKKHGKTCDFKIYPGVAARFCSDTPGAYHKEHAEDSLARTLDWFKKYLAPVTAAA